jgi:hypothetical protein
LAAAVLGHLARRFGYLEPRSVTLVRQLAELSDLDGRVSWALDDVTFFLEHPLAKSLASPPEKMLFRTYCERYRGIDTDIPALLPQVYLHYDPQTRHERGDKVGVLHRERMDFLLLLPRGVRVVLEVDGKQHYAEGDTASPRLYAEMVEEDRSLRLKGYEVYRFGGYELMQAKAAIMLRRFFDDLLSRNTV